MGSSPTYDPKRRRWTHERIDPPKKLGCDIVKGPLYTGRPATPSNPPPSSEFKPMREGRNVLPHQVVWANKGIKLLS
ncbi:MAG: hypothetical protein MJE63_18915 [Proteobacteria bacterium]|nr:hypothetical protein [Pseudomonadota bacterium]